MITQTSINLNVYLQSFSSNPKGELGNVEYSISFIQAKDMLIKTVAEVDAEKNTEKEQEELKERQAVKKPKSTVLQDSANLWTVAQQFTGDGGNWQNILDYNTEKISSADDAKAGMSVMLP